MRFQDGTTRSTAEPVPGPPGDAKPASEMASSVLTTSSISIGTTVGPPTWVVEASGMLATRRKSCAVLSGRDGGPTLTAHCFERSEVVAGDGVERFLCEKGTRLNGKKAENLRHGAAVLE